VATVTEGPFETTIDEDGAPAWPTATWSRRRWPGGCAHHAARGRRGRGRRVLATLRRCCRRCWTSARGASSRPAWIARPSGSAPARASSAPRGAGAGAQRAAAQRAAGASRVSSRPPSSTPTAWRCRPRRRIWRPLRPRAPRRRHDLEQARAALAASAAGRRRPARLRAARAGGRPVLKVLQASEGVVALGHAAAGARRHWRGWRWWPSCSPPTRCGPARQPVRIERWGGPACCRAACAASSRRPSPRCRRSAWRSSASTC
jgi:hypothetical protein